MSLKTSSSTSQLDELPKEVDWAAQGAVTRVKDQGMCGSCWSFSTIGAVEGAYFLKYHQLKDFSEQQLVDCDDKDAGCEGGEMRNALDWIRKHGNLINLNIRLK